MAADIRGVGSFSVGSVSPITLDAPDGVAEGDVLLAVFVHGDVGSVTWGPPSGWVEIEHHITAHGSVAFFKKNATASEPANYSFTQSPVNDVMCVCVAIQGGGYSAMEIGTVIDGGSNGIVSPSLTTIQTGCLVSLVGADGTTAPTLTLSGDLATGDIDFQNQSGGHWIGIATKPNVTAGSKSVTWTATADTGSDPAGVLLLVPDGGGAAAIKALVAPRRILFRR